MDVIRTIVSYIGESDKKSDLELTTQISAAVAYVIASYNENDTSELDDKYTVASSMLSNNASSDQLQALDDILILYALLLNIELATVYSSSNSLVSFSL